MCIHDLNLSISPSCIFIFPGTPGFSIVCRCLSLFDPKPKFVLDFAFADPVLSLQIGVFHAL